MTTDEPGRPADRRDEEHDAVEPSGEGVDDRASSAGDDNPVADAIDDAAERTGVASGATDPAERADRLRAWIEERAEEVEARERTRSGRTGSR